MVPLKAIVAALEMGLGRVFARNIQLLFSRVLSHIIARKYILLPELHEPVSTA